MLTSLRPQGRPPPPSGSDHLGAQRPPLYFADAFLDDEWHSVMRAAGRLAKVLAKELQAALKLLVAALNGQGLQTLLMAGQAALGAVQSERTALGTPRSLKPSGTPYMALLKAQSQLSLSESPVSAWDLPEHILRGLAPLVPSCPWGPHSPPHTLHPGSIHRCCTPGTWLASAASGAGAYVLPWTTPCGGRAHWAQPLGAQGPCH